ncbi:MAG TPA: hypothetical protein VGI58_08450 [Streptosporangiaceae bacterium]
MARILVQLKLRLLLNGLRTSGAARASFITSTTLAVLVAIGLFIVLALLRGQATAVDSVSVLFTVFAFGWIILPIFVFGVDGTLDPATLALYPLRTRPLVLGLLGASATGVWPLANVVGLLGVTVGLARGPAGVLVAILAVLLQVLFCIVLARLVITSLARLLRSRRGRDLAAFLIIPVFGLYEFFAQVVPREAASGKLSTASFGGIDAWLRWLPPGLAGHAIQDASDGRLGVAVARLAAVAAVIAVLGWLWVRSLSRAMVTTDTTTQSARARGAAVLPFARFGLVGTVAARTWIYQRRDPASLVYWVVTAVIMAAASASAILQPVKHPAIVIFSAILGVGFVGAFHSNAVGQAGPPFVMDRLALATGRELRSYFTGVDIVLGVIAVPIVTALSFALSAAAGSVLEGFVATAVGLAGLGAALGLSNIFTVVSAYPMVKRAGTPLGAAATGYGGYRLVNILGTLAGTAVAATPLIVAGVLTGNAAPGIRMPVLLACGAVYGFALAWAGVLAAARAGTGRLPELVQIAFVSQP